MCGSADCSTRPETAQISNPYWFFKVLTFILQFNDEAFMKPNNYYNMFRVSGLVGWFRCFYHNSHHSLGIHLCVFDDVLS